MILNGVDSAQFRLNQKVRKMRYPLLFFCFLFKQEFEAQADGIIYPGGALEELENKKGPSPGALLEASWFHVLYCFRSGQGVEESRYYI